MKHFSTIVLLLFLTAAQQLTAQSCYSNPSLEGPSQAHVVPAPWQACYGSPDTQPGQWGITQAPSNGNSYVSFLHAGNQANGYNEGMTQLLNPCLQAGVSYTISIDLAHTLIYNTASPNGCYSSLAIYGDNTPCGQTDTMWLSGAFTHTNWQTYTITFTPQGNWCYLSFSPYMVPNNPCGGGGGYINVMMDNISCVQPTTQVDVTNVSCFGACDGIAIAEPTGGQAPYTYAWGPGIASTNDTITGLCPGNYTLTVTDANNQQVQSNFTVTEPAVLQVNATPTDPLCNGGLDGSVTTQVQGGTTPYTYSWNPGGSTGNSIQNVGAGTYIVTVTDSNNCTAKDTVILNNPTAVTVQSSNVVVCIGQNGILTATGAGGAGNYTYVWDGGAYVGSPWNIGSVVAPSNHSVVAVDANGCASAPANITVTPAQALQVVASQDVAICNGETTLLTATGLGGDGQYTFTWAPGGTVNDSLSVTPNAPTTYTVTLTDACGSPAATDQVFVDVNELPVVQFDGTPRAGCVPVCVNFNDLTNVPGGNPVAWNWDFGDGTTSGMQNPSHCYTTPGSYDVTLEVTSDENCTAELNVPAYITGYPNPSACFVSTPNPTTLFEATVDFTFCGASNPPSTFQWDFGVPGATAGVENPNYTYQDTGTYNVNMIVTNTYGCSDTTQGIVIINLDFSLFIPNAFTPNEDGFNDEFRAFGEAIQDFQMYVFDRWGEKLFYSNKIDAGWDGTIASGSRYAKQDVYVYKIYAVNTNGDEFNYVGKVSLLR